MKTIRTRLVLFYVALVVLVMTVCGTFIIMMVRNNAYEDLEKEIKQSIKVIKVGLVEYADEEALQQELINIIYGKANMISNIEICLINSEGYEIYPTKASEKNLRHVVVTALNGKIAAEFGRGAIENIDGSTTRFRDYAEPIFLQGSASPTFVIYSKAATEELEDNLQHTIFIIAGSTMIAFLLAAVLGLLLANTLTQPIRELTENAQKISKGELDIIMEPKSTDEIGILMTTFNTMTHELNKTMAEMRADRNKLQTVFGHMIDGILVFNEEGELIHCNQAALDYLGETLEGNTWQRLQEIMGTSIDICRQDEQRVIFHNDRYINACFVSYTPENESNSTGVIIVLQDITRHKKLEELQKEFVANVSHEMRTPITTVKSYAETLLLTDIKEEAVYKRFLEVINRESDRMTFLVRDLLELSKLDSKQSEMKRDKICLNTVLREVIKAYELEAKKKEQHIIFDVLEEDIYILGDENKIVQVIRNILSNATKYSMENTNIKVALSIKEEYAEILIRDNGIGIPSTDIDRIFDRFYRVDKARSRAMGGTGLGLAIAKEIVEHHDGRIWAESVLGEGTAFYIDFPIAR